MLLFSSLLITLVAGSFLQLPEYVLNEKTDRLNKSDFYPPLVHLISKSRKPQLLPGIGTHESNQLSAILDSVPLCERIVALKYAALKQRERCHNCVSDDLYGKYLFSSRFIDTRLLRFLARIASRWTFENEVHISTATDIIIAMTTQYPDEDFSYLTTEYIIDWYNALSAPTFVVFIAQDPTRRRRVLQGISGEFPLVHLSESVYSELIIKPRLERVMRTGYENCF